jgi:hypothetical protein
MKCISYILFLLLMPAFALAQLEGVFVETYYVADSNDAQGDLSGSNLQPGEITYRVFLNLAPGSKVVEIFGDADHPFAIGSTRRFFNHEEALVLSYAMPISSSREDTRALDTYMTIGKIAEPGDRFAVPKFLDTDGNFIAGDRNFSGLLANEDVNAGIPLTTSDGFMTDASQVINNLEDFIADGIVGNEPTSGVGVDTSIFSFYSIDSTFYSDDFRFLCIPGVAGVNADSNLVLIAQLTTLGDISLQINAVIRTADGQDLRYVSTDTITAPNMVFLADLNYPPACGCTDPNYLEYSPDYACSIDGSCITPLVLGCTDTMACNYDTAANFNVQNLCCYPGFCQGRDLEEVCPHIKGESFDIDVFPNPAEQYATVQVISGVEGDTEIDITNYNGVSLYSERLASPALNFSKRIDISSWAPGVYHVRVKAINKVQHSILVKL